MSSSGKWSQEDDDRTAFEEAMDVADVSLRILMRELTKLRVEVEKLYATPPEKQKLRQACAATIFRRLQRLQQIIETPNVTHWRQAHSEGRGKRHSQQHVLECKLEVARELLTERGVDLDAECAARRLGS